MKSWRDIEKAALERLERNLSAGDILSKQMVRTTLSRYRKLPFETQRVIRKLGRVVKRQAELKGGGFAPVGRLSKGICT